MAGSPSARGESPAPGDVSARGPRLLILASLDRTNAGVVRVERCGPDLHRWRRDSTDHAAPAKGCVDAIGSGRAALHRLQPMSAGLSVGSDRDAAAHG